MSHPRRAAALVTVLIAATLAACTPGEAPSCGEYTLDEGQSIPQEAVDCMSESGEDGVLRVVAPRNDQGYTIATVYSIRSAGGIAVTTEYVKDNGARFMKLCPDAVSVVDLGECEELHEGD